MKEPLSKDVEKIIKSDKAHEFVAACIAARKNKTNVRVMIDGVAKSYRAS